MNDQPVYKLRSRESLVVFVLSLLVAVLIQWQAGAFEAEFVFHPDEPAHFVSSTLIYDYLVHGAPEAPLPFAVRYYAHYPKVGIGHWPPAFHTALALWMLIFGIGRIQAMLFMAVVMALQCLLTYALARSLLSRFASAFTAALLIAFPLSQTSSVALMTEGPVALSCLAALTAYVHYLRKPGWPPAIAFGLLAALGLLTKGTAVGLALVPLFGVVFLWRPALLKRLDFWAPAVIVFAIAGPWYLFSGEIVPSVLGGTFDRIFVLERQRATSDRLAFWVSLAGIPMLVAALAGCARAAFARNLRSSPAVAVVGGFVLAVYALNLVLPESAEPRHIHHAGPAVALFAAVGLSWIASLLPSATRPAVWVIAAGMFFLNGFRPVHKVNHGFSAIADAVVADRSLDRGILLITSEEFGEGGLIAEMALRNPHPNHVILRGNQLLARAGWSSAVYSGAYSRPEEVAAVLEAVPVHAIIVDRSAALGPPQEHHKLVQEALALDPQGWTFQEFDGSSGHRATLARTTVEGRKPLHTLQIYRGLFSFNPVELPVSEIGWTP